MLFKELKNIILNKNANAATVFFKIFMENHNGGKYRLFLGFRGARYVLPAVGEILIIRTIHVGVYRSNGI